MDRTFLKHNRFLGILDRKLVERGLAKKHGGAEELASVRDILYEDRWFRIATAVFTQIKRQFAEGAEAGEVIEAAEKRLFGLKLEVVEAPLLKIKAAVEQGGKIAAVRCRAALDVGVEAVFEGVAPGYKLKKTAQAGKTADADAASAVGGVGGAAGRGVGGVERLLKEVRGSFPAFPSTWALRTATST
jgi:hypothetical protein